jgi:PhzF family phenazine biosynthesis protein
MGHDVAVVTVFAAEPGGGNPAPIVVDAADMSEADMQAVARSYGHESGFVVPPPPGSDCDIALEFWVPGHRMEMCGHATIGAVWLLDHFGRLTSDRVSIHTGSGRVDARVRGAAGDRRVEITQPAGSVHPVAEQDVAAILSVLGITAAELAPRPVQNACTSRVKTLVPIADPGILDGLRPDFARMEAVCDLLSSTGLYPYAVSDRASQVVDARQFPRSSGYPEDAATGIAASALAFGLLENELVGDTDGPITVRQGRAMGRPSEMTLRFVTAAGTIQGCLLSGLVTL